AVTAFALIHDLVSGFAASSVSVRWPRPTGVIHVKSSSRTASLYRPGARSARRGRRLAHSVADQLLSGDRAHETHRSPPDRGLSVLAHRGLAATLALLGRTGLGQIGQLFPGCPIRQGAPRQS